MMIHLQSATPVDIMHLAEITLMMRLCLEGPVLWRKCCAFSSSEQYVVTPGDSRGRGRHAHQLSSAGFRLDWQCYGTAIILLDQNHSPCLRLLVHSVLIRPLSLLLSQQTAAFSSSACKSENNSLPPPVIPTQHSFFSTLFSSPHFIVSLYCGNFNPGVLVPYEVPLQLLGGTWKHCRATQQMKKIKRSVVTTCWDWGMCPSPIGKLAKRSKQLTRSTVNGWNCQLKVNI